jgi:ribosomal protein S27AE
VDDENRRRSSGKVQAVYSVTNKKIECFRCGGNHMARKCRLGFEDVTCGKCGKAGHMTKFCRGKDESECANAVVDNDDFSDDECETHGEV